MKKGLLASFMGLLLLITIFSAGFSINAISISEEETPECKPCNTGCDMEMVEIYPYYYGRFAGIEWLHFGCKVKNVGYETCSNFGYKGYAYRIKDNKKVGEIDCSVVGDGLHPGEETMFQYRSGIVFDDFYFPPTFFRLNFTVKPNDPNKENNNLEEIYLVWGGFMGYAEYMKITEKSRNKMSRILKHQFIGQFPLLNLLFQRLRI